MFLHNRTIINIITLQMVTKKLTSLNSFHYFNEVCRLKFGLVSSVRIDWTWNYLYPHTYTGWATQQLIYSYTLQLIPYSGQFVKGISYLTPIQLPSLVWGTFSSFSTNCLARVFTHIQQRITPEYWSKSHGSCAPAYSDSQIIMISVCVHSTA